MTLNTVPMFALRVSRTGAAHSVRKSVASTPSTSLQLSIRNLSSSSAPRDQAQGPSSTPSSSKQHQQRQSSSSSSSPARSSASGPSHLKTKPQSIPDFKVYTPSSRAAQQRLAAAGSSRQNNLRAANSKEGAKDDAGAAGSAEGADAGDEDSAPTPSPSTPNTTLNAPKPSQRFLHGQVIAPSAITPLSEAGKTSQEQPKHRAQPLLGPSANLAKRLDPFYKLGLNPARPSLHDDSYKNGSLLSPYVSTLGRILPRNRTGLTRKGQRQVGKAIRRARAMGLLPIFSRMTGVGSGSRWR